MDTITSVRQTGPRHYRIDGVREGTKNMIMLASISTDGVMRGWGQDFIVFDKDGYIRTFNARGKIICAGHGCYNPQTAHFGGVGGDQFTIITRGNSIQIYDKNCKRIR